MRANRGEGGCTTAIVSSSRRLAILEAAARLFAHYGHGKTTIADVAREAQIGVGTVYLEFESKEALVQELSRSTHAAVLEAMRTASERCGNHAARLTAVLRARTSAFVDLEKKGQHACELVHCKTEGVRAAHARFVEEERVLLAKLVKEGQDAGALAPGAPTSIAALVQRAFASLSPPWIFGCTDDPRRATDELCQLLLRGLLASGASRERATAKRRPPLTTRRAPQRSR